MYGQMNRWLVITSAPLGIIQGTFEHFSAAGQKHLGGKLEGKLIVSGVWGV